MAGARVSYQDMMSPLFLHPSVTATSIQVDKLQGSSDYRLWRRSMEINLSSKRKLGFVTGTIPLPTDDTTKAEMWETSNNMVIAWLTNNVSPTIKRSIMYMTDAKDIWSNLEKRFSLTNGSRKYKLSKDLYELKQQSGSITEYYTSMKAVWEELDSLNMLPVVTAPNPEVVKLLDAIALQREESRLFQFLNGLDEQYHSQRSQLLLQLPLPTVEVACSALEQEEAQRALLHLGNSGGEMMAMFSKAAPDKTPLCTVCGAKNHFADRCRQVVGYPRWHPRFSKSHTSTGGARRFNTQNSGKWQQQNSHQTQKFAATAQASETSQLFTPQQLEQLAKLIPQLSASSPKQSETDDEIDYHFSGMMSCLTVGGNSTEWIVDSGASDHMTPYFSTLVNAAPLTGTHSINLPTGDGVIISQKGQDCSSPYLLYRIRVCLPADS